MRAPVSAPMHPSSVAFLQAARPSSEAAGTEDALQDSSSESSHKNSKLPASTTEQLSKVRQLSMLTSRAYWITTAPIAYTTPRQLTEGIAHQARPPNREPRENLRRGVDESNTLCGRLCSMFCHADLCRAPKERLGATSHTSAPVAAVRERVLMATRSSSLQAPGIR